MRSASYQLCGLRVPFIVCLFVFAYVAQPVQSSGSPYYGKLISKLSELHHGVSGTVYAVDSRTIHIKDFTYDGQGPAAYFYVGNSKTPSNNGIRVRDERGSSDVLKRYRKKSITLTLPEGRTLSNIKWFSVWCDEFSVNFGDVKIPSKFDFPKPQKVDALNGVHSITSDNIVIVDAQTLLVPNLSFDGEAPDAKFWVGVGPKPSPQGTLVPDENGKVTPLRRYDRKTVVLTLPGDLTVFDIGHFGIWCEAFTVDFGHINIPSNLNVPPSLKMLGVSPQSKLNCEVLNDELAFEVRWAVAGDSIVVQLVSKLEDNEYMSFGLSGNNDRSEMVKGDVVVAWVDKDTLKGYANDYYLDAKSQCSGNHGSCPDERLASKTNSIRLLNAAMVNEYSIVTYQRTLKPSDEFDKEIYNNKSQPIIWAIGPLNQRKEVSFHSQYLKGDQFIDFGRQPKWNCPMPEADKPTHTTTTIAPLLEITAKPQRGGNRFTEVEPELVPSRSKSHPVAATVRPKTKPVPTPKPVIKRSDAWTIPPIECDEPDDGVYYAQMGPTGGKKGYSAITGHVGWGISWYINGLLIPEINVVRGRTYTFVTEGGNNPEIPARYHPFYITDDPVGGYQYKTPEERSNISIYAGVAETPQGEIYPTGTGRLCNWVHQSDAESESFASFGAYQRTLQLVCDPGDPGFITWTPDHNTPDTVYYQCFTHRYIGWKINVHDSCDRQAAGSENIPAYVLPQQSLRMNGNDDDPFKASPSMNIETRLKPNDYYLGNSMNNLFNLDHYYRKPQLHFGNPFMNYHHHHLNHYHQNDFRPSPQISTPLYQPISVVTTSSTTPTPTPDVTTVIADTTTTNATTTAENNITTTNPSTIALPLITSSSSKINNLSYRNQLKLIMPKPYQLRYGVTNRPVHRNNYHKKPIYRPRPMSTILRPVFQLPPKHFHRKQPMLKHYHKPQHIILNDQILAQTQHKFLPIKTTVYPNKLHISFTKEQPKNIIPLSEFDEKLSTQPITSTTPSTTTQAISTTTGAPVVTPSNLISIKPIFREIITTLKPAINTGFHPESVIIESGFKPILQQLPIAQDRIDSIVLQPEDTIGVINLASRSSTETFEPMFIPSPLDSRKLRKHDDEMAMAAERIDSFYLPPKIPLVSYDGKIVTDLSLMKLNRSLNTQKFIQNTPQFGIFKGELPPPIPDQVQFGVLTQARNTMRIDEVRKRRFAHHTPEHQQNIFLSKSSCLVESITLILIALTAINLIR